MSIAGIQIQPHQVSPLLATPRTIALGFAGAASYVAFIDPQVKDSLEKTRLKLRHWAVMYTKSLPVMGGLAVLGAVAGGLAYWKTKENLWLLGAGLMASLWPFTMIALMPINNQLIAIDKKLQLNAEPQPEENKNILNKISSWLKRHKVRVLISLVAAVTFYAAELKSTGDVKVAVNLK